MVDLFMYRDPDAKKVVTAEEQAAEEDGEPEQEGAAVADAVKGFEGEDDEGEEGDEKWGNSGAATTTFAK
jgi:TATA-binding protein-associated factor Taf7